MVTNNNNIRYAQARGVAVQPGGANYARSYQWPRNAPVNVTVNNYPRYNVCYSAGRNWDGNRAFWGGRAWDRSWAWSPLPMPRWERWNTYPFGAYWVPPYNWPGAYAAALEAPYAPYAPYPYAAPPQLSGPESDMLQQMLNRGAVKQDRSGFFGWGGPKVIKPDDMANVLNRVARGAGVMLTLPDGSTALVKNPAGLQDALERAIAQSAPPPPPAQAAPPPVGAPPPAAPDKTAQQLQLFNNMKQSLQQAIAAKTLPPNALDTLDSYKAGLSQDQYDQLRALISSALQAPSPPPPNS